MATPTIARTRGDTWTIAFTVVDTEPDTGAVAPYAGLAACAVVCTIRSRAAGSPVFWSGTLAGGQIALHPTITGRLTVEVPKETTAGATRILYDLDVEVTVLATGERHTPLTATVAVLPDVTRA